MLTSGNQYLRPEYLTPLPTTLDAKKSPLALLAQTCSQIGADAPNSKLLQSAEKSSKKSDPPKSVNCSSENQKTKPNDTHSTTREKSRTPEERVNSTGSRSRTPVNSKGSVRCSSNQSAASSTVSAGRKTPAGEVNFTERKSPEKQTGSVEQPQTSSSSSKTAFTPNILTSSSDPAIKDLPLGTFKPGVPPVSSAFLGFPGYPIPMDLMTNPLMPRSGGLNPYLNYGRMKPEDSLSVCRDPYCTGCSLSSHLLGASKPPPCPAGCTQCDHARIPTSTGYLGQNVYAHAQLAALALAQLPYVCSWMSREGAYCGKRFTNSEELLSHLRTHTSGGVSDVLGTGGLPPTHPLFHRTFPTPPLSPLATARFHPYSKPSLIPPSLTSSLPGFPLSHPGLSPYFSPYPLYGPRLGTAPGMHP